jgi:hypothetical protein
VAAVASGAVTSSSGTGNALAIFKIVGCVHCLFLLLLQILLALVLENDLHLLLEVSILISEYLLKLLLCKLSSHLNGGLFLLMLLYHELMVLLIPFPLLLIELL